jgi:hypothetical protein
MDTNCTFAECPGGEMKCGDGITVVCGTAMCPP